MTAGHGEKRTRHEDAALGALLSEPTIQLAAKKSGISESTLLRWLAESSFKARYRDARRQVVESVIGRLQQGANEAVDALTRNLRCGTPAVEVSAAKAVLDYAVKGVEVLDLAERIEQLEQTAELNATSREGGR